MSASGDRIAHLVERARSALRALRKQAPARSGSQAGGFLLRPLAGRLRRVVARPLRVAAAALLGAAYGPAVTTVTISGLALLYGLILAWPAANEMDRPLAVSVRLLPTIGLSLGGLAAATGGIAGAACALLGSGLAAGLEWAAVGALGAAAGLWLAHAPPLFLAVWTVEGAFVGGSVGVLAWLCCTDRSAGRISVRGALHYALAALAIAACTAFGAVGADLVSGP